MTTIAAFLDHKGNVAIGADTALTGRAQYNVKTKLFKVGDLWATLTGPSNAYRNLKSLSKEKDEAPGSPGELTDCVLQAMKDLGSGQTDSDGDWSVNFAMIIIKKGKNPYRGAGDGSLTQYEQGYCAAGSGHEIALGVLHVARAQKWSAKKAVTRALQAACDHDPYSREPFHVKVLKG